MSTSSVVNVFKDSEKVLRRIEEILDENLASQIPKSVDKRASDASGKTVTDTLNRIEEVIRNAPQTSVIPNKATRA